MRGIDSVFAPVELGVSAAQVSSGGGLPLLRAGIRGGGELLDRHANGLKTRDGQPVSDLMLAGEDDVFYPATGVIEGDRLIVRSDKVAKPVRVRFGWDQIANPNLVNRAGVPAATFDSAVPVR